MAAASGIWQNVAHEDCLSKVRKSPTSAPEVILTGSKPYFQHREYGVGTNSLSFIFT